MTKGVYDTYDFTKNILPSSIGFDSIFKTLEDMNKSIKNVAGYPPYNIKKVDENRYVIELAVAGFAKQDIDLELQDGVLSITGQTTLAAPPATVAEIDTLTKDGVDITYLYKGIADRSFNRKFTLADSVEIKNAELLNGMLKIWLEYIIPEHKKPKKININDSDEESSKQILTE